MRPWRVPFLVVVVAAAAFGEELDRFKNGVVEVEVGKGTNRAKENGTGFVVSVDGGMVSIVTARHLFFEGRERFAEDITVTFYSDKLHPRGKAVLLTDSAMLDLAVVEVSGVPTDVMQQAPRVSVRPESEKLTIGDTLFVFGGKSQAWQVPTVSISDGDDGDRGSGVRFTGNGVRSGFSGAALIDSKGRLAAIHLGTVENDESFGHAQVMASAYGVLARLGVAMNRVELGESQVTGNRKETPTVTAPGTVRSNSKDGLKYVWVPPGDFMMGCSEGDKECWEEEKPQHPVTITKGFWLGQTTVTVEAWKRYRVAENKPELPTGDILGRRLNEAAGLKDLPEVGMTWDEAGAFCEWAGGRLPTEAEWEYAARAGTTGSRYGRLDAIAWYADNSGDKRIDSTRIWDNDQTNYAERLYKNRNGPHRVARKEANAWQLYDMLGNVWQWTWDRYGKKYYAEKEGKDPEGPASGDLETLRGGSWSNGPRLLRVSDRNGNVAGGSSNDIGVRCIGEKFP